MRRVRREVPWPVGAGSRMLWALVLSAALHLVAILGVGGHPGARLAPKSGVIVARLVALPAATPVLPRRAIIPAAVSAAPEVPAEAPRAAVAARSETTSLEAASPEGTLPQPLPAAVELPAPEALPDSTHYAAKDLDVYPRLGAGLAPVYPVRARDDHIAGKVTLMVLVDEHGRVTEASVVDAVPAGVFEESARAAFLQSVFSPAVREGRVVRSRILVHVEFDPDKP